MVATRKRKQLKPKSPLKKSERDYDQQKYWNDRYAAKTKGINVDAEDDDHTDEWYFSYSDISDALKSYLKQSHRQSAVLDLGCGLSKIFEELSDDHFTGPFVGVDYSPVVINQCKKIKRNNHYYLTLDLMQKQTPHLPVDSFSFIIDKGTTDGILCNKTHLSTISNMYEHASRLLSSNGLFVIITIKTVDDEEWFEDCLIPALIRGSNDSHTKFIIHFHRCMSYTDGSDTGPNIFVIVKYDCKSYPLRSREHQSKEDLSQIVTVKCY
jgi:ubiquinone/menaquinone biosynthesis C-methylase UbiE